MTTVGGVAGPGEWGRPIRTLDPKTVSQLVGSVWGWMAGDANHQSGR